MYNKWVDFLVYLLKGISVQISAPLVETSYYFLLQFLKSFAESLFDQDCVSLVRFWVSGYPCSFDFPTDKDTSLKVGILNLNLEKI